MNLGIVGSRNYNNFQVFENHVNLYLEELGLTPSNIVSGGAAGADTLAEKYADKHKIPKIIFPADWAKYGRAAGPIRNTDIVKNSDYILAFLTETSRGTINTVNQAKKLGKPLKIINI